MLDGNFLKGYMAGIISACDTSSRAYELCYSTLNLVSSFDCSDNDIHDARIYAEHIIDLLYGN